MELHKDTGTLTTEVDNYAIKIDDGSLDTGMYMGVSSANDIAIIQTGDPHNSWSTRNLVLQPNGGNVGIGTANPGQKLQVNGNIYLSGKIIGSGAESTYGALTVDGTKGTLGGINFKSGSTNLGTLLVNQNYQGFYNDADNNWDWYFNNGVLGAGSVPWGLISGRPAGLDDGDQVGITSESDPTVPSWAKVSCSCWVAYLGSMNCWERQSYDGQPVVCTPGGAVRGW